MMTKEPTTTPHGGQGRRTRAKLGAIVVVVGVAVSGIAFHASAQAGQSATDTMTEQLVGIQPVRVLDTRNVVDGPVGVAPAGPIPGGTTLSLTVGGFTDKAGDLLIPTNATSVAVNITIDDDATLKSFLTVWPTGEPQPLTSVTNAEPGLVVANSAILKLGTDGELSVFNQRGDVNVIIDVTGYFVASPTTTTSSSTSTTSAPRPAITTDASSYNTPGMMARYTGTGWIGCSDIQLDLFGPFGYTPAAGITPAPDGSFSGTFAIPALTGNYLLFAHGTPAGPQCQALTSFEGIAA
jgi:hypothetical protein